MCFPRLRFGLRIIRAIPTASFGARLNEIAAMAKPGFILAPIQLLFGDGVHVSL